MKNDMQGTGSSGGKNNVLIIAIILITVVAGFFILRNSKSGQSGEAKEGAPAAEAKATEAAGGAKKGERKDEHKEEAGHDEKVTMTDAQVTAAGIKLAQSAPGQVASVFQLPGEIRFNEDATAHVVPRVAGIVDSVSANLGQQVRKGQVLAVLSSVSVSEQRSELLSAQKRLGLARTTAERERKLYEEKISAQQDYLQAEQALREAEIAVANATQKLSALGASTASGGLSVYELRAPFDGMVVEKHISMGESVKEDANVFTISDLRTVWATINVTAAGLGQVRIGQAATIRATGFEQAATGAVSYIGALIGEQTRAATARVTLANPAMAWRPGLFVNVELESGKADAAVTVDTDAVQTVEDKPTVFVKVDGGFQARPVKTGRTDGKRVEIVSGIKPGETYASQGSYVVKAEQGKSGAAGHTD